MFVFGASRTESKSSRERNESSYPMTSDYHPKTFGVLLYVLRILDHPVILEILCSHSGSASAGFHVVKICDIAHDYFIGPDGA